MQPTPPGLLSKQPPETLPRRLAFFGRDAELHQVLDALSPTDLGWGIIINGIGGMGKTSLAIEAAYRCKEQGLFDQVVFVSAKTYRLNPDGIVKTYLGPLTLDQMYNDMARGLGQPDLIALVGVYKLEGLIHTLQGTKTLFILDNVETLPENNQTDLAEFLQTLPRGCKAIVTSRRQGGEGARWLSLDSLDWAAANELIRHESERYDALEFLRGDNGVARRQQLFQATGGLPLALIWTLGLIRVRGFGLDRAITLLQRGERQGGDLQRYIFDQAIKTLAPEALTAVTALSYFPISASYEAWQQCSQLTESEFDNAVEALTQLALVKHVQDGERFALHPSARAYLVGSPQVSAGRERELSISFVKYWAEFARRFGGETPKSYLNYSHLDQEWDNIVATMNLLSRNIADKQAPAVGTELQSLCIELWGALRQYMLYEGHWDEKIQLSVLAYGVALETSNWMDAGWMDAGWSAYDVSWISYLRKQLEQATDWAARCEQAWAHDVPPGDRAYGLRIQALIAQERKEYANAEEIMLKALAMWEDEKDAFDISMGLHELGDFAYERADLETAASYFQRTLEMSNPDDKESLAAIYASMGNLFLDQQKTPEARECFEKELRYAGEIGRVDLVAGAQFGLARILQREGQIENALALARDAKTILEKMRKATLDQVLALIAELENTNP